MYKIILASASPRRKELLSQMGIAITVIPSECEEIITDTQPDLIVEKLSLQKAEDVLKRIKEKAVIIGSDTLVAIDGRVLGKPDGKEEAFNMLKMLSGKAHQVYTGVTMIIKDNDNIIKDTFHSKTDVFFKEMSDSEINSYIATNEPYDKAGAYGIQGLSAVFIEKINGDYNTVVGLPISMIYDRFKKYGIDIF